MQIAEKTDGHAPQRIFDVLLLTGLIFLLSTNFAAAQSPGLWALQRIVVANRLNQFATITDEHYDSSGGEVDVSADGRALDLCSGGFERMHFKWRFPQDITRVSDGGALSVSLEAGPAGQKEPCNGAIAAISDISIAGSAGISFPLSDDDMKVMDVDRFFSRNYGDAWAGRDPRTGLGSVGLNTREPVEGRAFAYFFIRIGLRGWALASSATSTSTSAARSPQVPWVAAEALTPAATVWGRGFTTSGNSLVGKVVS